jgi:UDPglucose 6-dehydrogenase
LSEQITVLGAGYVGLVTGACLAHSGHSVRLLDVDAGRVDRLASGQSPIFEPGLEELLCEGLANGRLSVAHVDDVSAVDGVVFIAVGTPMTSAGSADLRYVRTAIAALSKNAAPGTVVVMKSTVPPGTGTRLAEELALLDLHYVSNPEFLREGTAVRDWYDTDRIVLGGEPEATGRVEALYEDIDAPVLACDVTSAELIKYASNAFLATKISFINEIARLCDLTGADIEDVSHGVGMDSRIGPAFLNAGIGYGGSCFPKDTRALDFLAAMNGYDFQLLRAVIEVNARQRILPVRALASHFCSLSGLRVAVLGITFKPDTDDVRESPALEIAGLLDAEGADVVGYNPVPIRVDGLELAPSLAEAVAGAHAVIVAAEWREIADADWAALVGSMAGEAGERFVFDGRNCLDAAAVRSAGATYMGVGRPQPPAGRTGENA